MQNYIQDSRDIFHILKSEDTDDVSSCLFTGVCANSYFCPYDKKKLTQWLEDMNFTLSS